MNTKERDQKFVGGKTTSEGRRRLSKDQGEKLFLKARAIGYRENDQKDQEKNLQKRAGAKT